MEPTQEALDLLCASYLIDPAHHKTVLDPQFRHRLNLCRLWGISPGWRVLDVGCGQGDSAAVLAHVVGPKGHVTGIDPAPPTYGSPQTLGEAQAHLAASPVLGPRLSFVRADAPGFLAGMASDAAPFDAATMCHSLWYFGSAEIVEGLFSALAKHDGKVRRVCVAEWTGTARTHEQKAHELAARVQRLLHQVKQAAKRKSGEEQDDMDGPNVRSALDPDELVAAAEKAGWKVAARGVAEAPEGMLDGHWETQQVLGKSFAEEIKAARFEKSVEEELLGYIPKVEELVKELKGQGKKAVCMDAAWVVFER